MFANDRLSNDELPTFWNIFNKLKDFNQDGSFPAYVLLEDVEQWLYRSMDSSLDAGGKRDRVALCTRGVEDIYWSLRSRSELDIVRAFREFIIVESLVRALDGFLDSLGGVDAVLTQWSAEAWELAKEAFSRSRTTEDLNGFV